MQGSQLGLGIRVAVVSFAQNDQTTTESVVDVFGMLRMAAEKATVAPYELLTSLGQLSGTAMHKHAQTVPCIVMSKMLSMFQCQTS